MERKQRLSLRRIPLRHKLLSLIVLASTLPLAMAIGTMFVRTRGFLRDDAIALLSTRGEQLVSELDAFHAAYRASAVRLATFPVTRRFLEGGRRPIDHDDLEDTLAVYLQSDRRLRGVVIVDDTGHIVASPEVVTRGYDLSARPYVKAALAGALTISDVFVTQPVTEPTAVIAYAAPVVTPARKVVGIAIVYVHAAAFWEVVRQANGRAGPGSFSVLYDRHGIRIAHSFNESEVFRPAGTLPSDVKAAMLGDRRFGPDTARLLSSPSPMPEELARVLHDPPEGESAFRAYSPANGEFNLGVTKKLRTVPWTLFCLLPESVLAAPVSRLAGFTALGGGVIALLALGVGLLLSSSIIRSVRELAGAAEAMKQGNLHTQVKLHSSDELGTLGGAFNDMARSLSHAHDDLEERVKERTAALEEANQELLLQKSELQAQQDELRRQQDELQGKTVELARANRMKSEFLANMSHELRTPLNAIIGFSELLMQEQETADANPADPEATREYLGHVLDSGRHLLALINDILDLSKIEAGAVAFEPERCSPTLAVKGACAMVDAAARRRQVRIVQRTDSLCSVQADAGKLRQILLNLLSNAIKFSPPHSTIEVSTEDLKDGGNGTDAVRFVVRDQGPGIAPQLLPRLFEPFVQGEDPMVKKHQGTGLGLAITKRLVELHGGHITVTPNERGAGSVFSFTIPMVGEPQTRGLNPQRRLILLVDGDGGASNALAARLEKEGYRVASFDNGRDAALVAAELLPAAIILDPATERRDGLLVLDSLARREETRDIPVIISGLPRATRLLAKPLETQRLLRTLERVVNRADEREPTVLSIDDDPRVHELLRATLAAAGYRVRTASRPEEGLQMALSSATAGSADAPDVIIVDLYMPEMSGFEVIERLGADPRTRGLPIVVLTAAELTEDERARLRRQVRAIAEKGNVTEDELLAAVNAATNGERPRRGLVRVPSRETILIVDDNDTNRALARALLERRGFHVLEADGGEAGIALASREQPALIFLDLAMPGKDGYMSARELKATPATAHVPIIALTALAMSGDEQRAREAGIDGYLTKPIDQEALDALLARFLAEA